MKASSTIYTGPMKSGKSLGLIKFIKTLEYNKCQYLAFKPAMDIRNGSYIYSRGTEDKIPAISVKSSKHLVKELRNRIGLGLDIHTVVIDEIMLFDEEVFSVIDFLQMEGIHLLAAGLLYNFRRDYFLLSKSEKEMRHSVTMQDLVAEFKKHIEYFASCEVCGENAEHTQRLYDGVPASSSEEQIIVASDDIYEARCNKCHILLEESSYVRQK